MAAIDSASTFLGRNNILMFFHSSIRDFSEAEDCELDIH